MTTTSNQLRAPIEWAADRDGGYTISADGRILHIAKTLREVASYLDGWNGRRDGWTWRMWKRTGFA